MIVVCDPVLTWWEKHVEDLGEFYAENKQKHGLDLHREVGRPLHKVQANAVRRAQEAGASHVLFTEQDHWGYPMDGLDRLLAHDKDVVGFVTHYRCDPKDIVKMRDFYSSYPFAPMCMRKLDPSKSLLEPRRNLKSFTPDGLEKADLLTWAFTLVKMEVFERMMEAHKNPFEQWGQAPTDSYFCQYAEDLGIEKWVDGTTMIEHGDVPNELIPYFREMYGKIHADARREKLQGGEDNPATVLEVEERCRKANAA